MSQWRPVARERGMGFACRCDHALGKVLTDKLKIKRIDGNLLSNAIKYRKAATSTCPLRALEPRAEAGRGRHRHRDRPRRHGIALRRVQPPPAPTARWTARVWAWRSARNTPNCSEDASRGSPGAEQGTRFEVILPMTAAAAPLGESIGAAGVRVSPHSPAARRRAIGRMSDGSRRTFCRSSDGNSYECALRRSVDPLHETHDETLTRLSANIGTLTGLMTTRSGADTSISPGCLAAHAEQRSLRRKP